MSGDDDKDQKISPVTQEDPSGTQTPVTGASKPLLSKSTKFSFVGLADTEIECKRNAYQRLKEMKKEIKRFKIEADLDSDDSLAHENESKKRQKPLYEKSPIKPKKFPGKDYNRWESWVNTSKQLPKPGGGMIVRKLQRCLLV